MGIGATFEGNTISQLRVTCKKTISFESNIVGLTLLHHG
jgi:hypothetical protein